ncbi:3',5'-cyclic-nucleotide phosphodiesterase [Pseudocyphellaria aurata]|nr:3',5'-cyclic-nucleotide phosphodiesterase [Pseudocyphellaria aurata]
MDHAAYHIVYVDNRANNDLDGKYIHKTRVGPLDGADRENKDSRGSRSSEYVEMILPQVEEVRNNISSILTHFDGVFVCTSGATCIAKLTELESIHTNIQPTLVILEASTERDNENERDREVSHPVSNSLHINKRQGFTAVSVDPDVYGLALLQRICAEIASTTFSKLVVPVAMISTNDDTNSSNRDRQSQGRLSHFSLGSLHRTSGPTTSHSKESNTIGTSVSVQQMVHCLDAGAVEVLTSPLRRSRVYDLVTHGYRAHKEACKDRAALLATTRLRKRSWVGFDDTKPYAYLREEMVSNLMKRICNPDYIPNTFDPRALSVPPHDQEVDMARAIGRWGFCAHDYSDDQLVHAAFLMLQHALALPELDNWRLPADELKAFLMASRAAYNAFVHYHNFRHVVDVLQAVFYFLVQIGTLPPYPASAILPDLSKRSSPIAALLRPFDALTLMISAIGHDVGHPGVNNAFLVALKAPLAQLYNDKSVLEAFHCAAYSQILRRYWKHAFEDRSMRGLLISSILATDMGVHFKYMADLGNLQDKVHHNKGTEGWSPQVLDEYRTLTCGLLIKCADISNVARPFDVAAQWSDILQQEFANQGVMETEVGIPTTLFGGPPVLHDIIKLANSQIGFMNIFACPLFEAVTDILPAMVFAVDEMKENQMVWKRKIDEAKAEAPRKLKKTRSSEGFPSPRSGSPNRPVLQPEQSHPEGFPASHTLSQLPLVPGSRIIESPRESRRGSAASTSLLLGVPESGSPRPSHDMSRRSSLGCTFSYGSPTHDSTSFSRRSSGAFPGANIFNSSVSRRRSSNSLPSQLHLGQRHDPMSRSSISIATTENSHPAERASEGTLLHSNLAGKAANLSFRDDGNVTAGGGGTNYHRRSRAGNSELGPSQSHFQPPNHRTHRYANHSIPGPLSANSSRNRSSSGAQTSLTQSVPYSPTGTLATSFLTVDSDERSIHGGGEGWNSPVSKTTPDIADLERPGSGHDRNAYSGHDEEMSNGDSDITSTSVANGVSTGHGTGEKVLTRKSSRFRLFWRKK